MSWLLLPEYVKEADENLMDKEEPTSIERSHNLDLGSENIKPEV